MVWWALIGCITCVAAIGYSYVLYPMIMRLLAGKKDNPTLRYTEHDTWPNLNILCAVYNEEAVIEAKLQSFVEAEYPGQVHFHLGSDGSTDRSDEIIKGYESAHTNIHFHRYTDRVGKATILNRLYQQIEDQLDVQQDVLILTDANVLFGREALTQMVQHFKSLHVGQVAATIINRGMRKDGISAQEQYYIGHENQLKYYEGVWAGVSMGAFGACYALRAKFFGQLPSNYLMEDFYISMKVLTSGAHAIVEPHALCYEDVSNEVQEEFKRKRRISAGNYQNLSTFFPKVAHPFKPLGFAFWSHKLIRWMGPFLLLGAFACNLRLAQGNQMWQILLFLQIALACSPIIDRLLKKVGVHLVILRFVSYFYEMNLALLAGLFMYLKGVRSSAWQPTKRNVESV